MKLLDIYKTLSNPEVFKVNTMKQTSSHKYTMPNMESTFSLNGRWKFKYADCNEQRIENFYDENFDVSKFDDFIVPNHICLTGYGDIKYVDRQILWHTEENLPFPQIPSQNEYGMFIKNFKLPQAWNNRPVYVEFNGVEVAFSIWCNGVYVGYAEDSFAPSKFDLTPHIKYGENNKIAIEVYRYSTASYLEHQGFWRFWGIHRDVTLYTIPDGHIEDVEVLTTLNETYDKATLAIEHSFKALDDRTYRVEYNLYDEDKLIYTGDQAVIELDEPKLWSSEKPYLYKMVMNVFDEDGLVETVEENIGIREIKIDKNIIKVNGKRVLFRGVNRHDFSQHRGRVVSNEEMETEIKFMKENNFNAVRSSHYPNNPYFYELCDIYGLYVIDEANIETHGTWLYDGPNPQAIPGDKPEWQKAVIDRGRTMLERDKNHPSIIMWSLANESYGGSVFYAMSNYFRDRDPSRLVHYEGLFNDRSYNDSSDMESQMYSTPQQNIEFLTENPDKPLVHCEYIHAMGNSGGAIYKYRDNEEKFPHYQGGFVWVLKEPPLYRDGKYKWGGQVDSRPSDYEFIMVGILTADNRETPMVSELKKYNQFIQFKKEGNTLVVSNEMLFTNTNEYKINVSYMVEDKLLNKETYVLDIVAGNTGSIELDETYFKGLTKELLINVEVVVKEDQRWCRAGHCIAIEQFIVQSDSEEVVEPKVELTKPRLVDSTYNVGVVGENFKIQIARKTCKLTSLKYDGIEYIEDIDESLSPNFWRPLTNNDRSVHIFMQLSQWKIASLYQKAQILSAKEIDDTVVIETQVHLATTPASSVFVSYTFLRDGKIQVNMTSENFEGLSDMLAYGMSWKLPKQVNAIKWYGRGPGETYSDRKVGNPVGVYSTLIKDQFQYLYSQEYGNRTDVRWAEIHDNFGRGIKISGDEHFEFSARMHSITELEHYKNTQHLPESCATYLQVNKSQAGVGGYDSWFNWCEEEYKVKGNMTFTFTIEPLV